MSDELRRLADLGWLAPSPASDGVRYVHADDGTPISYPDEGFEVLGLEGGAGYWFDHRAAAVRQELEQLRVGAMWEIGAGTGSMAGRLNESVEMVVVEPLPVGALASAARGLVSFCSTLEALELPTASLEAVGAFDVLEHLSDPSLLVAEMRRVLRPGGLVIATVPALQALWGDEDDVAGHHRRYSRASLRAEFESHGFAHVHSQYLYASLVIPAALLRALPYRLGRRATKDAVLASMRGQLAPRPMVDRLMRSALRIEAGCARYVPLPVGLSVLGVFRAS